MIAPPKSPRDSFHIGVERALKRAVAKVWREAARKDEKLAVFHEGKARLVSARTFKIK